VTGHAEGHARRKMDPVRVRVQAVSRSLRAAISAGLAY